MLLVNDEDISRLEPSVIGERLRSGLFVVEVFLEDTASLDPKFARFSDITVRTVLTNDPGLRARHEEADRTIGGLISGNRILANRSGDREGLGESVNMQIHYGGDGGKCVEDEPLLTPWP